MVVSKIEQRTSWDIDYNRKLAQIAERSGFDYALSQIRFTAGYGAEYQHEPVLFSHALLAATERLKLIVASLARTMESRRRREANCHAGPAHRRAHCGERRQRLVPR